jgi:hypothetical protein
MHTHNPAIRVLGKGMIAIVALLIPMVTIAPPTNASAGATNAHLLSCAYGSIASHGEIPFGVPYPQRGSADSEFAEAVVEINRQSELTDATVSDFVLTDKFGRVTRSKEVVEADAFDPRHIANGSRPWDETLPAGKIRLRIRVALGGDPGSFGRTCSLKIGPYQVEGPLWGPWLTS